MRLQYPVSTPAVPCEYLGAPCALRRVVLCGACVPSHTRSAAILTHARSAAACVARDCVVCRASTRAARAPARTAVSAALYLLQPVDRRAVRLALPCELPLRRAEDLAEAEPHFVHHLRGGEPKCHSVPVSAAGSFQTAAARPLEASGWLGSVRYCACKRVRSSRRHCFTVGACGPHHPSPRRRRCRGRHQRARAPPSKRSSCAPRPRCASCPAAPPAGRIVANCEPHW